VAAFVSVRYISKLGKLEIRNFENQFLRSDKDSKLWLESERERWVELLEGEQETLHSPKELLKESQNSGAEPYRPLRLISRIPSSIYDPGSKRSQFN